jgi:ATP-dependent helicase HrpB
MSLPIEAIIPDLKAALAKQTCAVLVAAPGAGKTTRVPLALLDEPWLKGAKIIMLEPRRLAARAAATRMAQTLKESVGETVGLRVRLQSKIGPKTRIEVVTEGVFSRMILEDPGLEGVGAVLFDEFHERSLDADLGLALARDAQLLLRDDLRLLVMSATLDGARVSSLFGDAPVIESQGRQFPVETIYLGRDPARRLEEQAARAVRKALGEQPGSLLVFLPGQGEIRRVERMLHDAGLPPNVDLAPLYGALELMAQDQAIAPAAPGRRKVVLATSIAETSLTIEGVRMVLDCGQARVPRYDPASGLTRLETVRVSRAGADQRRGRAGRTEPGVGYRLWDEAETRSLPAFARPEILDSDLSGLALDLARWGAQSADDLAFLDRPPAAALSEARGLLSRLGALDDKGALTPHGEALTTMPLPPRLAHMVLRGAQSGAGLRAAQIAATLTERGLGGTSTDLASRLQQAARDDSPRGRDARTLATRWAKAAEGAKPKGEPLDEAQLLALAFPERLARARGPAGEYQLVSGRGAYLDPTDRLAREPWLAIGELGSGEAKDRILLAAPLDQVRVMAAFADQIVTEERLQPNRQGRLKAVRLKRLGKIVLEERAIDRPEPAMIVMALLAQVRDEGLSGLGWGEAATGLRARVAFLRGLDGDVWPDMSDAALLSRLEDWLEPLLAGRSALAQVRDGALEAALKTLVPWDQQRRLDQMAPTHCVAPTGSRMTIDYGAEGGPRAQVRVQELFGLGLHPMLAEARVPLTLALLSPAHRPIQVTQDLPGFWRGSWKEVRSEMRGRYPRHAWPEDPANAVPTTRAKPRGT